MSSALKRLTTGTLSAIVPVLSPAGTLAFTSVDTKRDVWSLPFDLDRGTPKGTLERVTTGPSSREHASLANDGRFLAFASNQSGRTNIWVRDLVTGKESPVAGSSLEQHYPVSNTAGDKIAFSVFEKNTRAVYVSAPGGAPERVCEGCLRATDWSRDGKTILVFGGDPYQIDALDVASHQRTPILKHPNYSLLYGRFSPDNRWVSFTVRTQPDRALHRHRSAQWAETDSRERLDHNIGRRRPATGLTGRRTGRRYISLQHETDTVVCGGSGSKHVAPPPR